MFTAHDPKIKTENGYEVRQAQMKQRKEQKHNIITENQNANGPHAVVRLLYVQMERCHRHHNMPAVDTG